MNLERFHSLNLVPDEKGILKPFITKLPPKLLSTLPNFDYDKNDDEYTSNILDFTKMVG